MADLGQKVIEQFFATVAPRHATDELLRWVDVLATPFTAAVGESLADQFLALAVEPAACRHAADLLAGRTSPAARYVRARLLSELGESEAAIASFGLLAQSLPAPDAQVLLARTRLLAKIGRFAEAAADLRLGLQLFPPYQFFVKSERLLRRVIDSGAWTPRRRAKAAILSSSTTTLLAPVLRAAGFRCGVQWDLHEGAFGSYQQEIMDPQSGLYRFEPDIVFIVLNQRDLSLPPDGGQQQAVEFASGVRRLWSKLRERRSCHVVQVGFDVPPPGAWGSLEDVRAGGRRRAVLAANQVLLDDLPAGVSYVDPAAVAAQVGSEYWNASQWHGARQYPGTAALPLFADTLNAHATAVFGLTAKVLAVDLDNTLWGGVIGEDLLGGIHLGPPSAEGEGYLELQQYLKELRQRGVLLAVCSKNNSADAELPFRRHDAMLLKLDDFVAFRANWEDKAGNLQAIAQDLSLGLDSFVFLDDNPLERALVRSTLPQVTVPECGKLPWYMLAALRRGMYFEAISLTAEDLARHGGYQSNVARQALQREAGSLEEFLAGLEMTSEHGAVDATTLARVTQLTNKTNQFNLTTRRYTEQQVRAMAESPEWWCHWFKLADRFGDHGLIGVILARQDRAAWHVDTWLMSCRVLGRKMEDFMCGVLLRAAHAAGAPLVRGQYLPTEKNVLVKDLYPALGFVPDAAAPGVYVFDTQRQSLPGCPFIHEKHQ